VDELVRTVRITVPGAEGPVALAPESYLRLVAPDGREALRITNIGGRLAVTVLDMNALAGHDF
jgi:hypothetical protein